MSEDNFREKNEKLKENEKDSDYTQQAEHMKTDQKVKRVSESERRADREKE
ncbi:hypothetical protein LRR81_12860 [Metabacillus sp. GX 13764]|uniref:hypothetical protein n=1 Tax=Metabacillus kandeliae TaxID=2900151 RepID=UPI001E4FB5AC|nr:hypothetical protein [Metabacillus kandeliae]MCD7035130.1 hypothetical protein [Metabacillus kandeliae]